MLDLDVNHILGSDDVQEVRRLHRDKLLPLAALPKGLEVD